MIKSSIYHGFLVKKVLNILLATKKKYKKNYKNVIPLCIQLPKLTTYRSDFDKTKYASFLLKDNELLEKYNKIWGKVSNVI